ncbi:MAG: NAD-dependent epimerase/dehydratase family protein [Planctomycetes bacterium]|nr:NAD-dependent epimerase/dehydratase family protein [Planctomycetota bacterium]MCB9887325.1 NAD-dependent epimerase/dehydratase family protein [Planctomycetota bacterium]
MSDVLPGDVNEAGDVKSGRVLVTGGAGFIGSHVCELLTGQGRAVVVLDDFCTGRRDNLAGMPVEVVEGSVADPAAVAAAMRGVDKVVHLAALPSVVRSVEDPLATHHACATGTLNVLHAARIAGARVVYAGSSSAYGDQDVLVKHEQLREDPLSPYAAAKLAGELYCRSFARVYGMQVVVTRFFNVFGPRQTADSPYSGVVAAFCHALLSGRAPRIDGDGGQSRDFTYVEDVVEGVRQCLDAATPGCTTVNLAYGQATTVRELYDHLAALAAPHLGDRQPPAPLMAPPRAGDVRHSLADASAARRLFGFAPRHGLVAGLQHTFDWYRSLVPGASRS